MVRLVIFCALGVVARPALAQVDGGAGGDSPGALGREGQRPLAQAITFELSGDCVTRENVRRGLTYWLRTDLLAADLEFRVRTGRSSDGNPWAEFALERDGEVIVARELKGAHSCDELKQALVLTMAIAVDGSVLDRTAEGRPDLSATPETDSPPEGSEPIPGMLQDDESEADPLSTNVPASERVRLVADGGAAVALGILPEATGLFDARVGITFPSGISLHLGVGLGWRREFDVEPGRGRAGLLYGRADGCLMPRVGADLQAGACGIVMAGRFALEGQGTDADQSQVAGWLAGGASGVVRYQPRAFFVQGELGYVFHLLRPRLLINDAGAERATEWPLGAAFLGVRGGVVL